VSPFAFDWDWVQCCWRDWREWASDRAPKWPFSGSERVACNNFAIETLFSLRESGGFFHRVHLYYPELVNSQSQMLRECSNRFASQHLFHDAPNAFGGRGISLD
jgi:hypothetical protein